MHEDETMGVYLREKLANFLLAQRSVTVAEEKIDAALDFHVEAGFIARVNPLAKAGRIETLPRERKNFCIVLARNDATETVGFQAFGEAKSAQARECAGLHD